MSVLGHGDPIEAIEWYVENLHDVIARKPVRGAAEAQAGYAHALQRLRAAVEGAERLRALLRRCYPIIAQDELSEAIERELGLPPFATPRGQ